VQSFIIINEMTIRYMDPLLPLYSIKLKKIQQSKMQFKVTPNTTEINLKIAVII